MPSNFLAELMIQRDRGMTGTPSNAFGQAIQGASMLPDLGPLQMRAMTQADAGPAPTITAARPRPRRSILDMLGGVADTIATVGGSTPLYQSGRDAQRARQMEIEDRQYQMDQRPLERQFAEQKLAQGAQALEGGKVGLQEARNAMLESASAGMRQVFGRTGAEGVQKAWPLLAKQLGLPDEKTAEIGQALAADPEGTLAALFPDPALAQGGSQAKEVQIYEMLKADDPKTAEAYRRSLANPEQGMTAYQREQVRLGEARIGLTRDRYRNPPQSASERNMSAKEAATAAQKDQAVIGATAFLDELEGVVNDLNASGGMSNSEQSIGGTLGTAAREYLPLVERVVSPEGFAARERLDGLLTQGVSALLPLLTGMTIGSKNMDAAKEMENLKRAVVSAKSYDAAMAAINQYRRNLQAQIKAREASPTRTAPSRSVPAARQQTGRVWTFTNAADWAKIPRGAKFKHPDGSIRTKP